MTPDHLDLAINAAVAAGEAILEIYGRNFGFTLKADQSPLTTADMASHRVIASMLARTGLPLLSEEGKDIPYHERAGWKLFWMVDPLDGTKEFIKRNGEFTVNIALVEDGWPTMGVIFAPVLQRIYFGAAGYGAFYTDMNTEGLRADAGAIRDKACRLPIAASPDITTLVVSRSHLSPETESYIEKVRKGAIKVEFTSIGSSLKFCIIAEGRASLYPRMGPTMEWDTAAGQAIVEAAGGSVMTLEPAGRMAYNKETLLNPWFIARAKG
jgi:3'(2'), 5'-bisphosphate nucleotidase